MFTHFNKIDECDRQLDRQMDGQTPHTSIGHTYTYHHSKNSCLSSTERRFSWCQKTAVSVKKTDNWQDCNSKSSRHYPVVRACSGSLVGITQPVEQTQHWTTVFQQRLHQTHSHSHLHSTPVKQHDSRIHNQLQCSWNINIQHLQLQCSKDIQHLLSVTVNNCLAENSSINNSQQQLSKQKKQKYASSS